MKNKIILGDLHFGIKKFSEEFFNNQMNFFYKELFPYMQENNISEIIQLGDIFDNRVTIDIKFLNLVDNFFNELKQRGITFYTLLGNHDIYYRNSRKVSLIEFFSKKYDNIILFKEKDVIEFEENKCLFVPWITKNEVLTKDEIKGIDFIFGHFEIRNFQIMPGIVDKDSSLSEDFFEGVKDVFSGHYHIKSTSKIVKYVGTPYQLNWGDFNDFKGFYVFNGIDLNFIENNVSKKFVKITIFKDKFLVQGLLKEDLYFEIEKFEEIIKELKEKAFLKIIEKESNSDVKVILNENKIEVPIIKEITLSETDSSKFSNTESYIQDLIAKSDKNLLKYYSFLIEKIKKDLE